MALQTERVDIVASQEPRIRRAMRIVARTATFNLDRRVLINKRPCLLCMALHTDSVAGDAASQSLLLECPVGIVTIAAAHQAFVHLVVERLRKSGLYISVAGIAEFRLRNLEKARLASEFMNAMATDATYVCYSVCGALEIRMCPGVALQALVIDCFRRRIAESEECFQVSASSLYMLPARSMAAFAGNAFAAMQHRKAGVRILSELLAYLAVTGFAGF